MCPSFTSLNLSAAFVVILGLFVTCCGSSAIGQPGVTPMADLASYTGPDRTQKLIAGAKREGTVAVYTSAPVEDMAYLAASFEKKYGVPVRVWRSSSENIVQRAVVEARGSRFDADVFETGGLAMESLKREELLQKVNTAALSGLIPAAIPSHREWIGTRVNIFAAAYNTRLIRKDALPKRYEDLLDRRWKGQLGVEAGDSDCFGTVVTELGEEKGLKLFRDIVATNGMSVRNGHSLLANLVVSGEVPFALTTYAHKVEQLRKGGAPIDWLVIPPGVARFEGAGVARRAPHPNGAILFFEFMLTDAQALLLDRDYFPASRKSRPLPNGVSVTFEDPAKSLDENQKWSKYFQQIFMP
jgi:iron(III) transport system substrate-binding protein